MILVYVIASEQERLEALMAALPDGDDIEVRGFCDAAVLLEACRRQAPDLVILDEAVGHGDPVDLVRRLLEENAMINTAMVSSLAEDVFHETTEGLGIMAQLSPAPSREAIRDLIRRLRELLL